jgi:hypothetical protein
VDCHPQNYEKPALAEHACDDESSPQNLENPLNWHVETDCHANDERNSATEGDPDQTGVAHGQFPVEDPIPLLRSQLGHRLPCGL